jgi:hypothetical protein
LAGVGLMARRVGEGHDADVTGTGRFSYRPRVGTDTSMARSGLRHNTPVSIENHWISHYFAE